MIDPLIGKQLGPNEITGFLGHGGMADVYRATQRTLKREVAIKVLVSSYARDKAFVERFTREVEVVARLEHPHIVPVYEHGITDEGVVYLAMRYLKGGTLADLIKQRGALPIPQVAQIMLQVGAALDYAHKQGVVHRDVKPSNVMLDENGDAYLTDFGLARPTDRTFAETLTEPGSMLGTPAYVSPEQIQENRSDARSDVYSLGIVLYEMLTGRPPFTGDSIYAIIQAHITKQLPSQAFCEWICPWRLKLPCSAQFRNRPSIVINLWAKWSMIYALPPKGKFPLSQSRATKKPFFCGNRQLYAADCLCLARVSLPALSLRLGCC